MRYSVHYMYHIVCVVLTLWLSMTSVFSENRKSNTVIVDIDFTQNSRINTLLEDSQNICFILYPGKDSINLSQTQSSINHTNKNIVIQIDKNGLNSILGDDVSTNSIGKSTLLMIIDFVFGGNTFISKNNKKYLNEILRII